MKEKSKTENKNLLIGFITVLFVCGGCALFFALMPDNKASGFASVVCARVQTHYNQPCDSTQIMKDYTAEISACMPQDFVSSDEYIDLAIVCLESKGVDLIEEINP